MGGFKRSLVAAGLAGLTTTAAPSSCSAYLFPAPSGLGSGLSSTSTSRAIADRKSSISSRRQHSGSTPSPRMSTMSPSASSSSSTSSTSQQQQQRQQQEQVLAAAAGGSSADLINTASGAQLASSLIFPAVTRQPPPQPRPGIIARDGTRDDGKRERDDGKSPDFEVNLGKVISTLREDYPRIFFDPPSFDIYTEEIELRDPVST